MEAVTVTWKVILISSNRVANLEIYDDGVRQFFESLDDNSPLGDLAKYPISTFYDTGFSMKTKMKIRNPNCATSRYLGRLICIYGG